MTGKITTSPEAGDFGGLGILEGDLGFEGSGEFGPVRCFVRHPDAGGKCERAATMEVYGLPFCEVHGAEAKAGALEELYSDAANFLGRLDNPRVPPPNPAALGALREAVSGLQEAERRASCPGPADEVLKRAYPLLSGRMEEDAADFDYWGPEPRNTPMYWNYTSRMLIHKLMRCAYEAGSARHLVEILEYEREHVSAQLAFALADYEERVDNPTSS